MSKFKVGDKVKIGKNIIDVEEGTIFIVKPYKEFNGVWIDPDRKIVHEDYVHRGYSAGFADFICASLLEAVHSPKHYAVFDDIEAIEVIARSMTQEMFKGYCFGNLLKYRLRVGGKDEVMQELAKSDKYKELYELSLIHI